MAMTLRLTREEQDALRKHAEREGISMQDAARRAIREYVDRRAHVERVADAATRSVRPLAGEARRQPAGLLVPSQRVEHAGGQRLEERRARRR
jgi:hypothetical protein